MSENISPPPVRQPSLRMVYRAMTHFFLIAFGFYLVFCGAIYVLQKRLIYFPSRGVDFTPALSGLDFEETVFSSGDGRRIPAARIAGWFVPSPENRGTLLFCHGNAGNISHRLESIEIFHRLGLSVFIFDYRGYGKSDGAPSEQGLYADARAAWDYLTVQRGIAPRDIVLFGRSLGGGVAAWLAAEQSEHPAARPGALILESTFSSLPDLGAALYPYLPVRLLSREHYDTRARMARIACPTLVAHSPQDEIVPYAQGRAVFEAAGQPKAFLEMRGDHNEGFLRMGRDYVDGLDAFLREHFDRAAPEQARSAKRPFSRDLSIHP